MLIFLAFQLNLLFSSSNIQFVAKFTSDFVFDNNSSSSLHNNLSSLYWWDFCEIYHSASFCQDSFYFGDFEEQLHRLHHEFQKQKCQNCSYHCCCFLWCFICNLHFNLRLCKVCFVSNGKKCQIYWK